MFRLKSYLINHFVNYIRMYAQIVLVGLYKTGMAETGICGPSMPEEYSKNEP